MIQAKLHAVGIERHCAFQQEFRIIQHAQLDPDHGEQAHSFDIARVALQVMAADFLGTKQSAFVEVVANGDQLPGQVRNPLRLHEGGLGFLGIAF